VTFDRYVQLLRRYYRLLSRNTLDSLVRDVAVTRVSLAEMTRIASTIEDLLKLVSELQARSTGVDTVVALLVQLNAVLAKRSFVDDSRAGPAGAAARVRGLHRARQEARAAEHARQEETQVLEPPKSAGNVFGGASVGHRARSPRSPHGRAVINRKRLDVARRMVDSAIILSGTDPYSIRHGGNLRTRALAEILDSLAVSVEVLFPERTLGKIEVQGGRGVLGRIPSLVRVVKRHYIPMPTTIGARSSALRRDILARSADLMVICVVCHAQYVRRSPALLWLDYMDVGSEVGAREAVQRSGIASLTARLQSRQLKWSEKRVSARAGLVTAAGWADHLSLRGRGINAHWIPTPLPDAEFRMSRSGDLRTRTTAGFLANFDYWPNRDAYQNLQENWLPRLRRYGYEVVVAGRGSEAFVTPPSGMQIIGAVGDVDEFYRRVGITLAPIRKGGGMKVKVLESLTRGIPVIGTNFAFEGFPPSMLKLVRVCEEDGSNIDSALAKPIPHVHPDSAELRSYRMSTVRQRVTELLEEVHALGRTCSPVLRWGADRAPDIATGGDDARDG